MAYVVTRPCRIGDGPLREPGEVLSAEELRGRNVRQMEDSERVIRFDPTVPEPAAFADGGDSDAGYAALPVAQLKDLFAERELDVPKGAKKAELVALLEQHDEEAASEEPDAADGGDSEQSEDQPDEG